MITSVITDDVSLGNRAIIEDFLRRYPGYQVYASAVYAGFTSAGEWDLRLPENRHEFVQVYGANNKSLHPGGHTILESLMLAEVAIAENHSNGDRIQFDCGLVDRYLPEDLRQAGWRCRHFWKGVDDNRPWGPYRIGLKNERDDKLTIEWDQPWIGMDLLVEDVRSMYLKKIDN